MDSWIIVLIIVLIISEVTTNIQFCLSRKHLDRQEKSVYDLYKSSHESYRAGIDRGREMSNQAFSEALTVYLNAEKAKREGHSQSSEEK